MFKHGFEVHCVEISPPDKSGVCRKTGEERVYFEVFEFDFLELRGGAKAPELFTIANDLSSIIGPDTPYLYQRGTVCRVPVSYTHLRGSHKQEG